MLRFLCKAMGNTEPLLKSVCSTHAHFKLSPHGMANRSSDVSYTISITFGDIQLCVMSHNVMFRGGFI